MAPLAAGEWMVPSVALLAIAPVLLVLSVALTIAPVPLFSAVALLAVAPVPVVPSVARAIAPVPSVPSVALALRLPRSLDLLE